MSTTRILTAGWARAPTASAANTAIATRDLRVFFMDGVGEIGTKTGTESEAGAKGKIELVTLLAVLGARNGETELQAQRRARHKQPQAEAKVVVIPRRIKVIGPAVDEPRVVKDREPDRADDIRR